MSTFNRNPDVPLSEARGSRVEKYPACGGSVIFNALSYKKTKFLQYDPPATPD
jgi:hypothetical protein